MISGRCVSSVAVLLLSISLSGSAHASDPPGMSSTGSPPPTAPPGPGNEDAAAQQRIAALKQFVLQHQQDADFAEKEDPHARCRVDHAAHRVHLVFRADGVLHCTVDELAEGYTFDVAILTIKDLYDTGDHYLVTVKPGDRLASVPVHGNADDAKAVLGVLGAPPAQPGWWTSRDAYGPYRNKDVTITITLQAAAVSEDTKLPVTPVYLLNVAVVAIAGPSATTYSVSNGKISSNSSAADLSYYFGVHLYPLSWNRNGEGDLRPGRYFNGKYQSFSDRFSVVLGANLSHPTQQGYIGLAIELHDGVSITGGWQPRKVQKLQSGHSVGDMTMSENAPTDSEWDLSNWGIGLSIDATVLKPITSLFSGGK